MSCGCAPDDVHGAELFLLSAGLAVLEACFQTSSRGLLKGNGFERGCLQETCAHISAVWRRCSWQRAAPGSKACTHVGASTACTVLYEPGGTQPEACIWGEPVNPALWAYGPVSSGPLPYSACSIPLDLQEISFPFQLSLGQHTHAGAPCWARASKPCSAHMHSLFIPLAVSRPACLHERKHVHTRGAHTDGHERAHLCMHACKRARMYACAHSACTRMPRTSGRMQARAAEDFGDEAGEEGTAGPDGDLEALAERDAAAERKGAGESKLPWEGTDRDYMYEELLGEAPRVGLVIRAEGGGRSGGGVEGTGGHRGNFSSPFSPLYRDYSHTHHCNRPDLIVLV